MKPHTHAGFTIVELLISITLLSLLISISFANYSKTNQKQTLISAGQNMKNVLRDAQNRAYSNEVDCDVCGCESTDFLPLTGWYVDFTTKTIYGECGGTQFSLQSFSLSNEIALSYYLTSEGPILFRRNPPGTNKSGVICLSHNDLSNTFYKLTVSASGEVSDNNITTACP